MSLQGSLITMSVSDLLQFLAVGRKTGLLKFSQQKVLKGIYFENGIIVGSSTNDPREYLGQVLIHYGKIDEAQLQAAMEIQRSEVRGQNRGRGGWGRFWWLMEYSRKRKFRNCLRCARWISSTICFFGKKVTSSLAVTIR